MIYWTDVCNQFLIFSILAMSLNLLLGYTGQLSVATAAFAAVGGYAVAYIALDKGWSFAPAVMIGMALALVIGVVVGIPALLLSSEYLVLLTLAVQTIILVVISDVAVLGGLFGLNGVPGASPFGEELLFPQDWLPFLLLVTAAVFLLLTWLGDSPFGRVLLAIREDQLAAQSLGKDVFLRKVLVFGLTSAIAALAGGLYASYNSIANPSMFGFPTSVLLVSMVVLGGRANMLGAVLGAAIVSGAQPIFEKSFDLPADQAGLIRMVAFGLLLVAVLVIRPQGLLPQGATPWGYVALRLRQRSSADLTVTTEQWATDLAKAAGATHVDEPKPVVIVDGIKKSFGGIKAVDGLSFELLEGRVTGLIGPNGAGKTTVYNLLTGVIVPDEGSVRFYGEDITGWPIDRVARHGMVRSFQDVRVFSGLSVLANVRTAVPHQRGENIVGLLLTPWRVIGDERRTRREAMRALSVVGLAERAEEPVGTLPFGEQKLVALARILAAGAKVVLLDEPASGIDVHWVDKMADIIIRLRDHGLTICLVEHNLDFVSRVADDVYFMEAGRISARGTMSELVRDDRLVEVYFGRP